MKKKPIALALVFAMLGTMLSGCGSKDNSKDTSSEQTASSQTETSQTETSQTDTSQTESEEPVKEKPQGSTLFIYMCGSNLETKQGLASKNIDELLAAEVSDDFNIVIQTGGAKTWRHHDISSSEAQRYIIKDGEL